MRRTCIDVPCGSVARISLIADWACNVACAMSVPQSKLIEISAEPRLVVDSTSRTFGTRRSASSTGIVTSVAICSAGRSPASSETTARGKATFGNSEIGRRNEVSAPAIASSAITNSSERRCFCIH